MKTKIILLLAVLLLCGSGCGNIDNRSNTQKAVDLCISKGGVPILEEDHWGQIRKSIKDCKFPPNQNY